MILGCFRVLEALHYFFFATPSYHDNNYVDIHLNNPGPVKFVFNNYTVTKKQPVGLHNTRSDS